MLVNPVVVVVFAAIGIAACRGAGTDPHLGQMILAAGICLLSSEFGILPVLFNGTLLRAHPAQAALLGTVVHLLMATTLSAIVFVWLRPPPAFLYWLLGMYWLTLGSLAIMFVKIVRRSPMPGTIT
jgi:hypothetical protein